MYLSPLHPRFVRRLPRQIPPAAKCHLKSAPQLQLNRLALCTWELSWHSAALCHYSFFSLCFRHLQEYLHPPVLFPLLSGMPAFPSVSLPFLFAVLLFLSVMLPFPSALLSFLSVMLPFPSALLAFLSVMLPFPSVLLPFLSAALPFPSVSLTFPFL